MSQLAKQSTSRRKIPSAATAPRIIPNESRDDASASGETFDDVPSPSESDSDDAPQAQAVGATRNTARTKAVAKQQPVAAPGHSAAPGNQSAAAPGNQPVAAPGNLSASGPPTLAPLLPSAPTGRTNRAHDIDYFFTRGAKADGTLTICKQCR